VKGLNEMNEMYGVKTVLKMWTREDGKEFVECEAEVIACSHTKDIITVRFDTLPNHQFFIMKKKNGKWMYEGDNVKSPYHFIAK